MTRKHVKARQARNRELAVKDAARRCAFCRRIVDGGSIHDFLLDKKFCNDACQADYYETLEVKG